MLCGPSFNTQLIRDQARGSTISEFCTCPPRQGQRERLRDEEEAEEAKLGPREAGDREQPRRWEGWGERVTNKGSV